MVEGRRLGSASLSRCRSHRATGPRSGRGLVGWSLEDCVPCGSSGLPGRESAPPASCLASAGRADLHGVTSASVAGLGQPRAAAGPLPARLLIGAAAPLVHDVPFAAHDYLHETDATAGGVDLPLPGQTQPFTVLCARTGIRCTERGRGPAASRAGACRAAAGGQDPGQVQQHCHPCKPLGQ